ncbi:MAG: response regulator [Candidatus Acidiferrales bacterium]
MKAIRVLLVDDSAVMRKVVERSLRESGIALAEVLEANDGWEALAAAREKSPDLILCDINMPTMDGIEFLRNLQGTESAWKIPVVMVSTEGGEARVSEALSSGAKAYISKPFTAEQLKSKIVPLFARERLRLVEDR